MADHQTDWSALLSMAEAEQAAFAALSSTVSSTLETCKGTMSTGGTLDKIIDKMVGETVQGAPGSKVAKEVAGIAGQARKELRTAISRVQLGQKGLMAANTAMLLAAAKVKAAHDRVMGI